MKSEVIGCATSIQPAPWRSRMWLLARMARIYTSTPSNHFIRAKNFWCGTATNLPSAAITLHWLNWLLITQVCLRPILGHFEKFKVLNFWICFLSNISLQDLLIKVSTNWHALLCSCLRIVQSHPQPFCEKKNTKEVTGALKTERFCL